MEKLVSYLEKLGYSVEELGRITKFLTVLKDGRPIGFILPDFSVSIVNNVPSSEREALLGVIRFVREYSDLEPVGGFEYQIAAYRGTQLTAYFDPDVQAPRYAVYVPDQNGEVVPSIYDDAYIAQVNFAILSQLIHSEDIVKGSKGSLRERAINSAINFLAKRKTK